MKKIHSFLICFLLAATALVPLTISGGSYSASADEVQTYEYKIESRTDLETIATNVNNGTQNYAGYTFTLTNDLELGDWTPIGNAQYSFKGTFDGDGHILSNIKIKEGSGTYQGLFGSTDGAIIKNVLIKGFSTSSLSDPNGVIVGALVGKGINTTIENCEVEGAEIIDGTEPDKFEIVCPTTMGSVAGTLVASQVSYTSSYMQVSATYDLQNDYSIRVGGFVGNAQNTAFEKSSSFGGVSLAYSGTGENYANTIFYVGGFAGELSGTNHNEMHDCVIGGEILLSSIENQKSNVGAVAGRLSESSGKYSISSVAYTTSQPAFALNDAGYSTADVYVMQVSENLLTSEDFYSADNGYSFDMNGTTYTFKWSNETESWDFQNKWVIVDSKMRLQLFQYFQISLKEQLDEGDLLTKVRITDPSTNDPNKPYLYNTEVDMVVTLGDNDKYYSVSEIFLDNKGYKVSEFTDGQNDGQAVKISSNGEMVFYKDAENNYHLCVKTKNSTKGVYSFKLTAIEYNAYFIAGENGSISVGNSARPGKYTISKANDEYKISAKGDRKYKFKNWSIYNEVSEPVDGTEYKEYDGKMWEQKTSIEINNLTVKFGDIYFDQNFLVEANFEYDALKFSFNYDPKLVSKIEVIAAGETESVTGSIDLDKNESVTMKIYVNKKVNFKNEDFEGALKQCFKDPKTLIIKEPEQERRDIVYVYSFSTAQIKKDSYTFEFQTEEIKDDSDPNLTLYICLGSGGGAIVIGSSVGIVWVSRRKKKHGKVGKTKTKDDYKNYYY